MPVEADSAVALFAKSQGTRKRFLHDDDDDDDDQYGDGRYDDGQFDALVAERAMESRDQEERDASQLLMATQALTDTTAAVAPPPPGSPRATVAHGSSSSSSSTNSVVAARARTKDPNFLAIDESSLPIEFFDTLEAEERDRSPEEWLRSTSPSSSSSSLTVLCNESSSASATVTGTVPYWDPAAGEWAGLRATS